MDREQGHEIAQKLVRAFAKDIRALKSPAMSEQELRREYIDPFFEALGWDVNNRAHLPAWQKGVLVEPSLGSEEEGKLTTKKADYLFRSGGFSRFDVEPKRAEEDIRHSPKSIFQTKKYAWNSGQIPFAILTNFDDLLLFDSTIKPHLNSAERGLVQEYSLRFEEYDSSWNALWDIFSSEAVAADSLERLLATVKRLTPRQRIRGVDRLLFDLKGSEPVDRAFLADLDIYR